MMPTGIDPYPWMTRDEAMDYLKISPSTLHRKMIPWNGHDRRKAGKIRTAALRMGGTRTVPRLLKSDVYALLPRPDGVEAAEPQLDGATH